MIIIKKLFQCCYNFFSLRTAYRVKHLSSLPFTFNDAGSSQDIEMLRNRGLRDVCALHHGGHVIFPGNKPLDNTIADRVAEGFQNGCFVFV